MLGDTVRLFGNGHWCQKENGMWEPEVPFAGRTGAVLKWCGRKGEGVQGLKRRQGGVTISDCNSSSYLQYGSDVLVNKH